MKAPPMKTAPKRLVTQKAKELLGRNAAFARIPKRTLSQMSEDMISIAVYLTAIPRLTVQQIDFPEFVSGLINGVFRAIVTYSIDQMKAYAELVKTISKSLDEFSDANISDQQARSFLEDQCRDCFRHQRGKPLAKRKPATSRQQLLATMVMMGINRIVVTDGKISAK
jgi:hypothetical protein